MRSRLLPFLFSICIVALPVAAADGISPSNVVLNAHIALKAEMAVVYKREQDLASAVARSQSFYWDYERITYTALEDYWPKIDKSGKKWELISAVGHYLNHALSRLMGSTHAVSGVTVEEEFLDESGEVAAVTTRMKLQSAPEAVPVYFYLHPTPQGWKIFNFTAPSTGFHLYQNVRNNVVPALKAGRIEDAIAHLQDLSGR